MLRSWRLLGQQSRLSVGVPSVRPPCATRNNSHPPGGHVDNFDAQQHLQKSLELGPASKQAPDFEYVAVAFRTKPRRKRRRNQRMSGNTERKNSIAGVSDFLDEAAGKGYLTMEVVSGDRRLLFEDTYTQPKRSDYQETLVEPPGVDSAAAASAGAANSGASTLGGSQPQSASTRRHDTKSSPAPDAKPPEAEAKVVRGTGATVSASPAPLQPASSAATAAAPSDERPAPAKPLASRPQSAAAAALRQASQLPPSGGIRTAPSCQQQHQQHQQPVLRSEGPAAPPVRPVPSTAPPRVSVHDPSADAAAAVQRGPPHHPQKALKHQGPHLPPPPLGPSPQRKMAGATQCSSQLLPGQRKAPATGVPVLEATLAQMMQVPAADLRRHHGLHTELLALQHTPEQVTDIVTVLLRELGLVPEQLRDVLLSQPFVLRLTPRNLAERGAALAATLKLPPPPGGGELAAAVAAAPDVLLRRHGLAAAPLELAAALAVPTHAALEVLRQQPQLLRHPPGYFGRAVGHLQTHLGLTLPAAASLAAAEPSLLSVSPGVLSANLALLRRMLQLDPPQVAAVVAHAPDLLSRPPGMLRAVTTRLMTVLNHSQAWHAHLPRLLASARNLAVALSFESGRYERLEYLAATRRDGMMGFKDALSLADEDFEEVFPEYPDWRRETGRW